jgi:hypothetical protein
VYVLLLFPPLVLDLLPKAAVVLRSAPWDPNRKMASALTIKLASLLLRIPPHQFPNPLITVINSIQSSTAASAPLPESAPGSGYNTPLDGQGQGFWSTQEGRGLSHRVRLWSLEWLSICVQELGRAAIGEQKAYVPFLSLMLGVKETELMIDWH